MAIFIRCDNNKDIINGMSVVLVGNGLPQTKDLEGANRQHIPDSGVQIPNNGSINYYKNLDLRYKVAPSGWNA